jgi:hypothetical protein
MLDRLVAEIGLDRSGIDAVVGQLEAAGVAMTAIRAMDSI